MTIQIQKKLLKVKDLSITASGKNILTKVNFTLPENSLTLLLGPNAAGKTSLAGAIMGLDAYTVKEGLIDFDG
ncbi:MAG TPA: ATP-binding cassette domain-containing protein, partial [Candidatus Paceibacterota bacterium]|nr:ATP-binding cassette domain-containing protein [Candidatus Paceibacterota bacterium]